MTDSTRPSYRQRSTSQASAGGGNAVYGLGPNRCAGVLLAAGRLVRRILLAILKAMVWPAFLVDEAFQGPRVRRMSTWGCSPSECSRGRQD